MYKSCLIFSITVPRKRFCFAAIFQGLDWYNTWIFTAHTKLASFGAVLMFLGGKTGPAAARWITDAQNTTSTETNRQAQRESESKKKKKKPPLRLNQFDNRTNGKNTVKYRWAWRPQTIQQHVRNGRGESVRREQRHVELLDPQQCQHVIYSCIPWLDHSCFLDMLVPLARHLLPAWSFHSNILILPLIF